MPGNTEKLVEELENDGLMTAGIEHLIDHSDYDDVKTRNVQQLVATFYATLHTEKAINELITSNEKLSKSSDRYALALNILTGALVFVGVLQIITLFVASSN